MTDHNTYSYTVLRYIHDTTTGEFVNVGVALHAPGRRYASADEMARHQVDAVAEPRPGDR